MSRRNEGLSQPSRPGGFGRNLDPDAFGRFAEAIARTLGTGRFLVVQTAFVAAWVVLNIVAWKFQWDPYPFIALNLAFSTQAAYAAPLILLAQNRQDDRDRAQDQEDRQVTARTQADTEYLARELASVRLTLADVVTAEDLHDAVHQFAGALETLNRRLDQVIGTDATDAPSDPDHG